MQLRCHKIVVTGGASGIGLAIAKRLGAGGARIVITGRHADKLEAARAEIGPSCVGTLVWDIANASSARSQLLHACEMLDGFDGLVNNAAVGGSQVTGRGYEPWDITPEEWDTMMNINLKGAFFAMREAVNLMLETHAKGNILNLSSNAACMDIIGSYGAAKLSMLRMTRAFGKRFGADGIIINGIAPGATLTPMIARYAHSAGQPYPRHAIGRFIRPDEIAELAAYLMSDFGEIICGHTVVADGGDREATL